MAMLTPGEASASTEQFRETPPIETGHCPSLTPVTEVVPFDGTLTLGLPSTKTLYLSGSWSSPVVVVDTRIVPVLGAHETENETATGASAGGAAIRSTE